MNYLTLRRTAFAALCATAALFATVLAAQATSEAGSIELLAIDADPSGNTPLALGEVDVCSEIEVGDEHEIDVIVRGVPEASGRSGQITGVDFSVDYDVRYVEVVGFDITGQMLGQADGSNLIDFTDPVPDTDGTFRIAAADFATDADESGDGVLVRITLRGIEIGTSELEFSGRTDILDSTPVEAGPDDRQGVYDIDAIQNALISVGVDCAPGVTPPPVPSRTPTPTPAPVPTKADGSTLAPGETLPGQSPGDTGSTSETDAPGNGASRTGQPGLPQTPGDDDGDSNNTIIIVALVATGLLLALAAAGFIALRRRGSTPS